MKLSRIIPLLITVALLSYFVGLCNIPWRYNSERLERNPIADLPHKELKRITSPDGAVDAILARVEADSLSADGFAVYLGAAGKELDLQSLEFDRKVFYASRIDDLELVWREPKFLEIRYSRGDIFNFHNNWWLHSDYTVEIRIIPKSESFSLSK